MGATAATADREDEGARGRWRRTSIGRCSGAGSSCIRRTGTAPRGS
jgi:hypothetical protein